MARHICVYKLKKSKMAASWLYLLFYQEVLLCDFSLHWHPYLSACLNCPNWVFANSVSHKIDQECAGWGWGGPCQEEETAFEEALSRAQRV